MKHHKLIIFYGSSPGTGKSTLSSFLFDQLALHEIPVLWVYEDDVLHLPEFAEFVADIQSGNPQMMDSLLQATRTFVQRCLNSNVVAITDSIFPCTSWLISTDLYSQEDLVQFTIELEQILALLHPLVIYLDADPRIALQRAIQQRGAAWFQGLRAALNSYKVNREKSLQTLDDVVGYFETQGKISLDMLQRWSSELLIFDAVQMSADQLKATILRHLGFSEKQRQPAISIDDIESYLGVYQSESQVPITNPLMIGMEDGRLHANTYWPNGCPLIAEINAQFRLEHTSHRIRFEKQPDGSIVSLTYSTGGNQYRYKKVEV